MIHNNTSKRSNAHRQDGSIELIVVGLLAALILVLALPVLDISGETEGSSSPHTTKGIISHQAP